MLDPSELFVELSDPELASTGLDGRRRIPRRLAFARSYWPDGSPMFGLVQRLRAAPPRPVPFRQAAAASCRRAEGRVAEC